MEHRFCLSKNDKELLAADIAAFLDARVEVETAYLFGSFFTVGTFGDIDIGVVFRGKADAREEIVLEQALEKESLIIG